MTRRLLVIAHLALVLPYPAEALSRASAQKKAPRSSSISAPKKAAPPIQTPAVIRRFAELEKMEAREKEIFGTLHGNTDPQVLYDLSWLRFQIANFKRAHELFNEDEFRRYLFSQVVPPLRLNLRAWVKEQSEGQMWMGRSFLLVDEVMAAAKRTIPNVPDGKNEDVVGKATWYGGESGTEFHHAPTAHGDTFCMFGQTAAYMRAPLDSWIRVKNPVSGRWIDLRVNDTGGFEKKGRVIDLSRGAYAYLKVKNNGKVWVRKISPGEAIFEPILCDGRGHFNNKLHLDRTHCGIPPAWRAKHLD